MDTVANAIDFFSKVHSRSTAVEKPMGSQSIDLNQPANLTSERQNNMQVRIGSWSY
jgi:hypothetical protein